MGEWSEWENGECGEIRECAWLSFGNPVLNRTKSINVGVERGVATKGTQMVCLL